LRNGGKYEKVLDIFVVARLLPVFGGVREYGE